jgi:hypothetical protein
MTEGEWNRVDESLNIPDSSTGSGIDYENVNYISITAVFGAVGDTLADMKVDTLLVIPTTQTANTSGTGAGDASEATLSALLTCCNAINAKLPTLGQTTKAGSVSVAIASDQESLLGGLNEYTTATDNKATVGTTASTVLAANAGRLYAILFNHSSSNNTIYLGLGYTPTTTTGIPVRRGAAYEINAENLFRGAIEAIADNASASLHIVEGD